MKSEIINEVYSVVYDYLNHKYSYKENKKIIVELSQILDIHKRIDFLNIGENRYSYEEVQVILSSINEKEGIRKNKGVYYTPKDIVQFILTNAVKLDYNKLTSNNIHVLDFNAIPYRSFCYEKSVFDPTCGSGVFLLMALEYKLNLLDVHFETVTLSSLLKAVSTIKGNDINLDSIIITKIRLLLCILERYGVDKISGIAQILNKSFTNYDYVSTVPLDTAEKFDIIVGNPPYVEDNKSNSTPNIKYGNIYANVLEHSILQLKENGTIGFVIPLSYTATPRMKKIRNVLSKSLTKQYILNYSDRPDCLFTSVHQKLCVLLGSKINRKQITYTSNYQYWYKKERNVLFDNSTVVKNEFGEDDFVPKLGNNHDVSIYKKVISNKNHLSNLINCVEYPLYLNMRATFWIKAFTSAHKGSEYKIFGCRNESDLHLSMCLLNSSLFWWYWVCVSDCWHITKKELSGFKFPNNFINDDVIELSKSLEKKLEETKKFVGTKQVDYEYKHKLCINEIQKIDDYINSKFGLSEEESIYVKNFALRYRLGEGVK